MNARIHNFNARRRTPNTKEPCYDCGSTIPGRHTPLCDFARDGDIRDLGQKPGTQHWDRKLPT